jgi:8-oxo-dGTP pyrophosphatase MutT (NUDIX family)
MAGSHASDEQEDEQDNDGHESSGGDKEGNAGARSRQARRPVRLPGVAVATRAALLDEADTLAAHLARGLHPRPLLDPAAPPEPGARAAAVLAPLYAVDGRPHLLFTRRTAHLRAHSGQISFPGGSFDPDDASLQETALREAREELALDTNRVETLGYLPPVFTVVSNYVVQPLIGWLGEGRPPLRPNPDEVAEVIEAPLAALADPAIFHEEVWTRGGLPHAVDFYDFGPYRIWGLTARILSSLLALLPAE